MGEKLRKKVDMNSSIYKSYRAGDREVNFGEHRYINTLVFYYPQRRILHHLGTSENEFQI
jgi:hypothetical protein